MNDMESITKGISNLLQTNGYFIFEGRYFDSLQKNERAQILNYKLVAYLYGGTEIKKLQWFKTINIAGKE